MKTYCIICKPETPKPRDTPGHPIEMPGIIHRPDCPTFGGMFESNQKLIDDIIEHRRRTRRGMADMNNYLIG